MLLAPVYALTVASDTILFNSIEFWAGENPINGKPHIFDTKTETMLNINDDLDPSLKDAPLDPITSVNTPEKAVYSTQMKAINENTVDFHIVYNNGEKAILRGEKEGQNIHFYMDGELVTTSNMAELEQHIAKS